MSKEKLRKRNNDLGYLLVIVIAAVVVIAVPRPATQVSATPEADFTMTMEPEIYTTTTPTPQTRPGNCATAVAMGLNAEQAAEWPHLDRDDDGVACYGD